MPRWERVLEPLEAQLRPDGTVGPVRFHAVTSRPFAIRPISLPVFPVRPITASEAPPIMVRPMHRDALPVLGRLKLHLQYLETAEAAGLLREPEPIQKRPWFRHEAERLERVRRRARRVNDARLEVPSSAPAAIESLVEYFGLRAVSSALANLAAIDDYVRQPSAIGHSSLPRATTSVHSVDKPDARSLTARERGARRGFYVA